MGTTDPNIAEFTHQAEAFAIAPVFSLKATLDDLVELSGAVEGERWLDAPCGAGHVSFALARRGVAVVGVDLTPAMVDVARREAAATSGGDTEFVIGDVTALNFRDGAFDGALTRFSLHHIADPAAAVAELARAVKAGGNVVISDHITDGEPEAADWHNEFERLRDPSHQRCLTADALHEIAEASGLMLLEQRCTPFELAYSGWLDRGSGSAAARDRIAQLLLERPHGTSHFRLSASEPTQLGLTLLQTRWRKQ